MKRPELEALCWAALEAIASKHCCREQLIAGSETEVHVRVSANVGTNEFKAQADAIVSVGHDGTRLTSSAAPTEQLVGYLLSLLSRPRRLELLRDLPRQFAANDQLLPAIDAGLVDSAKQLLKQLRAQISKPTKGAVSVAHECNAE